MKFPSINSEQKTVLSIPWRHEKWPLALGTQFTWYITERASFQHQFEWRRKSVERTCHSYFQTYLDTRQYSSAWQLRERAHRPCSQSLKPITSSRSLYGLVIFLVLLPCVVFVFVFLYIFVLVGSRQRQERLNFPNSFSNWTGGIYNQLNFKEASNVSEWTFDGNFRKPDILCVGSPIEKNTRFACANSITRENSFFWKFM